MRPGTDFTWLYFFLGFSGLAVAANWLGAWKARAAERERWARPCKHGTVGAVMQPRNCARCVADEQARQAEERRQQEEHARILKAARQRAYNAWLANIRLPQFLQAMPPDAFESLVCKLYERRGYEVETTRYTSDNGIDGILRKEGRVGILQAKRFKGAVGEPVLRDLYGTVNKEKAHFGVAVTTGTVSNQARRWVQGLPIEIVTLDDLLTLLKQHFTENEVVPDSFSADGRGYKDKSCPRCGREMRLRHGRRGKFYGCVSYPSCKGTRDA